MMTDLAASIRASITPSLASVIFFRVRHDQVVFFRQTALDDGFEPLFRIVIWWEGQRQIRRAPDFG